MYGSHIQRQILADPPLNSDNTLHVVGVISNYARYHSRYRLFREWYARMQATPNVKVYVVEAAFGDRAHEVTSATDPTHLQVRTSSEIWTKENLINLGVRHLLPRDWSYLCWSDCDISWADDQWAVETMQQLQHFAVVQPWQTCLDLGPTGAGMQNFRSFGYLQQAGIQLQKEPGDPYALGHTGFAWACRRELWEAAQGLYDKAILGSGDHHMAWSMIGDAQGSIHGGITAGYKQSVFDWQAKVVPITLKQVGFVPGRIEHSFHGAKSKRQYQSRWNILITYRYDPATFVYYDRQGVLQLKAGHADLEAAIRHYNRARDEDGTSEN